MTALAKGLLIALEGIDGAGKTTQAQLLLHALQNLDLDAFLTKEPTTGPWGQKIRRSKILGRLPPEEEYDALLKDRHEHVLECLLPALEQGQVAIVDRYYFSTMAYQGALGHKPWPTIQEENEAFAPRPDLLVLLELPVAQSLARIQARQETEGPDAFEEAENLRRCAKIFAQIQGEYVLRLDATLSKESLHAHIMSRVVPLLDIEPSGT